MTHELRRNHAGVQRKRRDVQIACLEAASEFDGKEDIGRLALRVRYVRSLANPALGINTLK